MKQPELYVITLHRPNGVTVKQLKQYILDAVYTWGGQGDPVNDPLFYPWSRNRTEKEKFPPIKIRKVR